MKPNTIVVVLLIVIIAIGGFFAGMKYQQSKSPAGRFGNFQNGRNGQSQSRAGQGFRPVNGEIINADDKSITVKLQDGTSKIIILSDKTQINKASEAPKEELKIGEQVAVFGTENPDGTVTARNIQLNKLN